MELSTVAAQYLFKDINKKDLEEITQVKPKTEVFNFRVKIRDEKYTSIVGVVTKIEDQITEVKVTDLIPVDLENVNQDVTGLMEEWVKEYGLIKEFVLFKVQEYFNIQGKQNIILSSRVFNYFKEGETDGQND